MDSTADRIESPEIIEKRKQSRGFFLRAISYLLAPFVERGAALRLASLNLSRNGDGGFDWNWGAANFNRIAITNLLVLKFEDANYLEIGCDNNTLFDSVAAKRKTGVDPSSGGTIRDTSDNFFATNTETFDVVFIDGLHTYEQVRRDVLSSIRASQVGGYIIVHDMLPSNWIEASVPPIAKGVWTGDVWKIAFELVRGTGLEFKIIAVDHGVGVIKVLEKNACIPNLNHLLHDAQFSFLKEKISTLPVTTIAEAWDWLKAS